MQLIACVRRCASRRRLCGSGRSRSTVDLPGPGTETATGPLPGARARRRRRVPRRGVPRKRSAPRARSTRGGSRGSTASPSPCGADAGEAERERLPQAAHRREVEPRRAVVPVRSSRSMPRRDPQRRRARRRSGPARAKSDGVDRRRQRAAVRGARLVEVEVRLERARRDLVGDEVVEHQHVRLLQTCAPWTRSVAEQQVARRSAGAARVSAMISGSSAIEARELLVEPGLRVVAVDERIGELEPARAARASSTPGSARPRGGGSSAPSRS